MVSHRDKRAREFYTFCALQTRASSKVWYKYKINKTELWLLCSLYGMLLLKGANPVLGKDKFFRQLTGNVYRKCNFEGYLRGCVGKGFIQLYEFKKRPGSNSLGITDLGFAALDCLANSIESVQSSVEGYLQTASLLQSEVSDQWIKKAA